MAYGSSRYNAYNPEKKKKDISQVTSSSEGRKNNGGLLGGLGYVGGSIAAGIGGIGEGILDLGAAGIALLGGDKEYAKYVFKDNVVGDWHQSLTEDYNPGKVMQFIGDVGQGLGQSATMLIPYVGPYAFFLGVGSQGISGAAEKTGDVGFKEVAYGATSGLVEGGLEWALGAAGQGAKSIASAIAKRGGKGAAKTLFSTAVRRGLAGKILSSAAGEFLEEAASEVVDVGLQRLYKIDPNASTSLKDVLYAGIVGAVSGGIMGGSVNVVQTLNNRATGHKIVQNGNAQTLINTANLVADKLAGQGTNFRKAPEWVKTLRGEIDAYNKLVEKGEQSGAKGETILGELQASLFFAETQAVASGLAYSIQQSSEENRATLAEYVNQTIPKDKRAREYTAEDIAKDTDGITLQLAILQFAGNEFINYADAIASLEADQAQEGAIGDVVGEMQGEEAQRTAAEQSAETPSTADAVPLPREGGIEIAAQNQANAGIFDASAGVSTEGEVAKSDLASPLTDAKYSVATAKRAQKRIKENAARAERARQARLDEEGQIVEGTNQKQSAERKNEPSPSTSSDGATSTEVEGNNEPKIRKPKEEILTDVQRAERAKERAKKLIEYEATVKVTSKELNTAREYVKDFDNLPKGARQAVIKMIRSADGKVDKKILAGVANLMTMRRKNGELVMPDLELRFAEGIVDGGLYTHIGEGENRRVLILINSDADFKETVKGTIAHEVVHYIENRKGYRELADYVLKTAKKKKISEIEKEYNEHYKAIYAEEAEKAGLTGEAITKKVAERMATEDHKELIKSEVVAKLIGLRLNNEKFLQKYATKDDAMIKKIFRFLRASVSYLKDKDKATADEVTRLVNVFSAVITAERIKTDITGESARTKTAKHSFAGVKAKTADKLKLATAQKMLESGVDSETVRKETGWFKGYDGKWRFEIDDFESSLIENPNLERHEDDGEVYFTGKLTDIFDHKALFAAYPELNDINIIIQQTGFGVDAIYQPNSNYITLSREHFKRYTKAYNEYLNGGRKAEIEQIEQSVEFKEYNKWYDNEIADNMEPTKWLEEEKAARDKFFSSELGKRYHKLKYSKDGFTGEKFELGWDTGAKEVILHELQHAIQKIEGYATGTNTKDKNYDRSAGEIEAFDVGRRANLTAEERKNTRPDIDREDVVFVKGSDLYNSIGITTNNRLVVVVNDDITKGLKNDTEIKNAVKVAIRRFKKVPINKQSIYFISDTANEYTSSKYTTWIEHNDRTTFLDKMRVGQHPQDIIYATTNYINEGLNHPRKDNIIDFARGKILIDVSGNQYDAEVVIGFTKKGICELHDIVKMTPTSFRYKENAMSKGMSSLTEPTRSDMTSSNNSIPQKSDLSTGSEKKVDGKRDLAPRKKKTQTVDKSKLNENGEVKDEFFAEAVGRMYQKETRKAQNTAEAYKEGNKVLNNKIKVMEQQHKALASEIIELEDRVHFLESKTEAYVEGNQTLGELLSAARKKRNNAVMKLEEVRAELRQMGYDLEAEKRKVKRREEQIDKQKKMLKDAEREKARLEREFKLISEVEAREIARLKKQLAKERAEIGKVYSEAEIRREIKTMMESGLISKFFGGQYKPNLPMEKLNLIARYIAIELNTAGTAEGKRADALLEKAADEIVARLKFTDEDNGKKYVIRDLVDAETLEQFVDFAKTDIRDLFNNVGTINAYSELVRQYKLLEQKYNAENDKASEKAAWGKEFPKTYQAAMKIKALAEKNKGAGSDSVQFISKTLASVVDTAGHMNLTKVDEAAKAISDFLDGEIAKEEAERAQLSEGAELTSFSWDTYEMIRSLVNEFVQLREDRIGEQLTSEELRVFGEMLRGMKHVIERYNKEFVGSHLVNADTVVTTEITDLLSFAAKNKEYKTKVGKFLGEKLGKTLNQLYFYNVLSPETVIEAVEGFKKDGLLKTLLHSIREAEQSSRTMAARMKDPFVQFMDNKENVWTDEKGRKHSFRNKLNDKMIKIKEKEISLGEAIYLYMLTKREHSHIGLKDNGYITYNDDGSVKETIYVLDPQMTRSEIESQLDAKDKEFLKMSEQFFNETASKIKYDADMKIFGFSNNQSSYYVPIIRDRYARMNGVSDPRMGISSIITVYNKSFTQALVRNNNALEGKSIMRIIDDHADGLADYSELYLPLKAFDRLYNRRVILDDGHAMSIRQVLNQKIWNGAEGYLTDLFKDVQGQSRGETSVVDAVAGWLRSGWVNSLLGANLKVVATQTTSLAAATQVIEGKYITAALSTITPGKDVSEIGDRADKYSKIIFARHFEMGALKSQGNIDKVTEIGKKTGALIEWMDRRVCLAIFHAAELKAEAQGHGAVGTESNSIAAAKIADKAIFTTQAMNGSTERSALQRAKSEIAKMFSMFTSDTVKQLSHLYGNTMKYLAHKERARTDKSYEALLDGDKKEMLRSMRTLAIVGVMIGLITQGFKYLYGKEEEEPEDKVKDLAIDVASSTLNILPVWSDVIDKLFLDYDMSVNVLDVANDTLETVSNGFKLAGKVMSGEYVSNKEIGRTAVNIGKSTFSLFGWPVAPVERTVTGLMRRFTPSAVYGYDAMFKNPSYTADLQRAVEKGNERLAEHILGQLYRNEVTGVYTSEELEIVADLYSKGYTSVIPQRVGETINDVKLDRKQRQQFNKIYAQASPKIMEMIATAEFKALSEEQQAKAIKNLYSLYYNRAASTVAGKEISNAQMYSWLTDNYSALFTSQAYKGGLDVIKDSKGKEVSVRDQFVEYAQNLGLSESDLVVVEFANGVRDKQTKAALIEHINTLTLSDEQKAVIAEKLSLEVKDGKLVEKKE